MKIKEFIDILSAQIWLARTVKGRPISEYGINTINSTLEDTKNQDSEVIQCINCGFIVSSLLTSDGCPNCHGHDLDIEDVNIQ